MSHEELQEIKELLKEAENQQEQLEFLMDVGQELEEFPKELMIPENKVPGCISHAFISAEKKEGKIYFKGTSEALVVKAYIAILVKALSGLTPQEIISEATEEVRAFLDETNVKANLTPSRANAFENVFALMKQKAEELE